MTLDEYRRQYDLTIYDLGRRLDLDPSSVSRLCRGERMPCPTTMDAIGQETKGRVTYADFRNSVVTTPRGKPGGGKRNGRGKKRRAG